MKRTIASNTLVITGCLYFAVCLFMFLVFGCFDKVVLGIRIRMHSIEGPFKILFFLSLAGILLSHGYYFEKVKKVVERIINFPVRYQTILCAFIIITGGVILCFVKIKQYYLLQTTAFDHGIFANVCWNIIHGNGFYSSLRGINFLSDHFAPILALTGPLYYVWNDAGILLILQSFGIAIGALAVYLIACRIIGDWVISLLVVMLYFSNYYLHLVSRFDFHPIALVIPIYLWVLYFLERKKWVPFFFLVALAFLVKENVPLALSGLAVFMCFRRDYRKYGVILLILSASLFVVEVKVLIPMFSKHEGLMHLGRYSNFGSNFDQIFRNIFFNPGLLLDNTFLDTDKLASLYKLFRSFGFLPLLSGLCFFPSVFPIMWNLMSSYHGQWEFHFQYSASVVPFLIYASIYGLNRLLQLLRFRFKEDKSKAFVWVMLVYATGWWIITIPTYIHNDKNRAHVSEFLKISKRFNNEDKICAQTALVPHLALRKHVFMFGMAENELYHEADYVVLDLDGNLYPFTHGEKYLHAVIELLQGEDFGVSHFSNSIIVLKRNYPTKLNQTAISAIRNERLRKTKISQAWNQGRTYQLQPKGKLLCQSPLFS